MEHSRVWLAWFCWSVDQMLVLNFQLQFEHSLLVLVYSLSKKHRIFSEDTKTRTKTHIQIQTQTQKDILTETDTQTGTGTYTHTHTNTHTHMHTCTHTLVNHRTVFASCWVINKKKRSRDHAFMRSHKKYGFWDCNPAWWNSPFQFSVVLQLTIKFFHNYVFHEPSKMLPHQRLDNLSIWIKWWE